MAAWDTSCQTQHFHTPVQFYRPPLTTGNPFPSVGLSYDASDSHGFIHAFVPGASALHIRTNAKRAVDTTTMREETPLGSWRGG